MVPAQVKLPRGPIPLEEKFPGCWVVKMPENPDYYDYFEVPEVFKEMGRLERPKEKTMSVVGEVVAGLLKERDDLLARAVGAETKLATSEANLKEVRLILDHTSKENMTLTKALKDSTEMLTVLLTELPNGNIYATERIIENEKLLGGS